MKTQSPPHSEEAEKHLIGALMMYGRQIEDLGFLSHKDFYDPKHETIYSAMEYLRDRSTAINMITVAEELRRSDNMKRLGAFGNEVYLAELAGEITGSEGIATCALTVREKSVLRQVILETQRISELAYRAEKPAIEIVNEAQAAVLALGDLTPRKEPKPFRAVLHTALQTLQERSKKRSAVTGVPSGIENLDELTGGFQPGNLVIIAARPGMGKSALAETFSLHASELSHPCLMFSLEMTDDEVGQRAMSAEAGIDGSLMRTGLLRDVDWIKLTNSVQRMKDYPFWVDDDGKQDLMSISAIARRWRKNTQIFPPHAPPLGLIVVDYMQLIEASPGKRHQNREREVAEISLGLKTLAKELNLPVIALAQLNRECEKRTDKRPIMSDLKESGSIEQDANLILLVYRDEVYNKDKEDCELGTAEIIIAKHRGGAMGTVKTAYIKEHTRFANLRREDR